MEEFNGRTKQGLLQFSLQNWQSPETEALLCSFPGSILLSLELGKGMNVQGLEQLCSGPSAITECTRC